MFPHLLCEENIFPSKKHPPHGLFSCSVHVRHRVSDWSLKACACNHLTNAMAFLLLGFKGFVARGHCDYLPFVVLASIEANLGWVYTAQVKQLTCKRLHHLTLLATRHQGDWPGWQALSACLWALEVPSFRHVPFLYMLLRC